jgi:hypothetical protein
VDFDGSKWTQLSIAATPVDRSPVHISSAESSPNERPDGYSSPSHPGTNKAGTPLEA